MTYIGVTPQGKSIPLPPPASVKLNRGEDAPADGFIGVFPLEKSIGNITGIRVYDKKQQMCFDGIVDEQKEGCAEERKLTLIARSRAALLLDNEAMPQTYNMPSLKTIFTRHVQPYGFQNYIGENRAFSGELMITKGMSEWQAAEKFCTCFLKVKPRIFGGVFDASGKKPQGKIIFDNVGGTRYSSITIENQYYHLLSELMVKLGESGVYCLAAQDVRAASLGVQRRRYLSNGSKNADKLISDAARKAFRAIVTCPWEFTASLLTGAVVRDATLGEMSDLYISEIAYSLDSSGESSRIMLRRW